MIVLTTSEVKELHAALIAETGGLGGIRDEALLESAVLSAAQSFADQDLYPTAEQKAARLAYGICKNHPFLDGNKRTAILVMLMTLKLNHITCNYSQQELVKLGLGIADGSIEYDSVLEWINTHKHQ